MPNTGGAYVLLGQVIMYCLIMFFFTTSCVRHMRDGGLRVLNCPQFGVHRSTGLTHSVNMLCTLFALNVNPVLAGVNRLFSVNRARGRMQNLNHDERK